LSRRERTAANAEREASRWGVGLALVAVVAVSVVAATRIVPAEEPLGTMGGRLLVGAEAPPAGSVLPQGADPELHTHWALPSPAGEQIVLASGVAAVVETRPYGPFPLPASLAPGPYRQQSVILRNGQPERVTSQRLGAYWLPGRTFDHAPFAVEPATTAPPLPIRVAADAGFARLETVSVEPGRVAPGGTIEVRLAWAIQRPAERHFVVFVHLLAAEGPPVAQSDSPPATGNYPTTSWIGGTAFVDTVRLTVPAGTPPGTYRVMAGLYDAATIRRLPVRVDDNEVNIVQLALVAVGP
jgi:hypothetical protein